MVSLGAQYSTVLIFENYIVVKVRKAIFSSIRDFSKTYFIYDSIPTNKLIACQHIGLHRGIIRYNYSIILLVLCLTDYRAVIIFEYYGIGGFCFWLSFRFNSQRRACRTCVIRIVFSLSTEEYVVSITIKTGKYIALLPIYTVTAILISILCNQDDFIIHFFEHSRSRRCRWDSLVGLHNQSFSLIACVGGFGFCISHIERILGYNRKITEHRT